MCLVISRLHHLFCLPKVAKKDIPVYKVLICTQIDYQKLIKNTPTNTIILTTPYQDYEVRFENGMGYMESPIRVEYVYDLARGEAWMVKGVNIGIHAFRNEKRAAEASFLNFNRHYFKAIIPKGSKYFIGKYKDIVSDHLIVFANSVVYEKYLSKK